MPAPPASWKTRIDELEEKIASLEDLSLTQTQVIGEGARAHFALSDSLDFLIREAADRDIQLAEHIACMADKLVEVMDRLIALENSNVDWQGATVQ